MANVSANGYLQTAVAIAVMFLATQRLAKFVCPVFGAGHVDIGIVTKMFYENSFSKRQVPKCVRCKMKMS